MVVIGSPSSSFSGASTNRSMKGIPGPWRPLLFFLTASRVLVTLPESSLLPKHAKTKSPELSLEDAPAGAGFEVLAEVVDAQDEAPELLCDRLQHVHDGWPTALSYSSPARL